MPPVTQDSGALKAALFEQFARVGKALASGRRLEIIELLAQRERTVEDLARLTGMSAANTSSHLQVLRRARLVEVRRDGLHARNRLAGEEVFRLWKALRDLGENRLAEVQQIVSSFWAGRQSLRAVTARELRNRLESGGVIVLDVRPSEEYNAGHIPGARSIPLPELKRRLKELPRSRKIVAYCRGPYCLLAYEAVSVLRARGYQAFRLDQGLPEWRAGGNAVAALEEGI